MFEDLLFIPWVRTALALVLPVAVMFLLVRIILLNLAHQNRQVDEQRRAWEAEKAAEAQAQAAMASEPEPRRCTSCGVNIGDEVRFCPSCGAINA